ncbi:lamin tail domain-containing protein [Marinilabilia rubra]|uniref:LTD domain-containing protein n=1 Tax=Marinilabilia rubra TaxID=2162893 RepID=A0A2U2BBR3_9BACT|nr:lamin tail domain-containing protein [Marinilabilia rubra]PWE00512.1 hypothetical protein DDZ16_06180 [Marinilabilia rubra]
MKSILRCFLVVLLCYPFLSLSFGDFLNPFPEAWTGDTNFFVSPEEGNIIQLNAPEVSGEAFLFTNSQAFENASWEMAFQLDFNPSSSNYFQVFLATDGKENFKNGFYLVVGTSDDNISLWERRNGEDRLLIEGREDLLDMDPVIAQVRVEREKGGEWFLETNAGSGWQQEGQTNSKFGLASKFFGLSCHYTKTRFDKFWFGPVSVTGEAYTDTVAPAMVEMNVVNGTELAFTFSEEISIERSQPSLTLENSGTLDIFELNFGVNSKKIILGLKDRLPDFENGLLTVSGWSDASGTAMEDTTLQISYLHPAVERLTAESYHQIRLEFNQPFPIENLTPDKIVFSGKEWRVDDIEMLNESICVLHLDNPLPDAEEIELLIQDLAWTNGDTLAKGPYSIYYHEAAPYDIVISEIMHDPTPSVFLPEAEYLELYNRSDLPVSFSNMSLMVNANQKDLPDFLLFPGEYVVLVPDEETGFENALHMEAWSSLTNGGGEIILRNPSGLVVASFRYPGRLSGKSYKQSGGWSLEVVDTENLSGHSWNWTYCQNEEGGTPGFENSVAGVNTDLFSPSLQDAWLEIDSVLKLVFAEPLDVKSVDFEEWISENVGLNIDSIIMDEVFRDVFTVTFGKTFKPNVVESFIMHQNIRDLEGNYLAAPYELPFGFPGRLDSFDVVINELMFDPPSEGADYVEIFNRSDKIISLDSLCLARNDKKGDPEELVLLSDHIRWLLPGHYLCLTQDAHWLKSNYPENSENAIREIADLPNYVNEGGTVFLTRLNGQVIDRFDYEPERHFELLSHTKGVALERTNYDAKTNNPLIWHSASSTSGYGTPGASNSQLINQRDARTAALFELSPEIFTPNLDGTEDQLIISYAFEKPGQKGSFSVFDAEGNEIRRLVDNQTLDTSGQITWDGITDDHTLAAPGIYIIWGQVFDLNGNVRAHKDSCVLGVRKN